jgi:2-keto-4-pentenoate hydratase
MSVVERFAAAIENARKGGAPLVLDGALDAISVADAARVQQLVLERLGDTVAASKVAINKRDVAVIAPIAARSFVESGASLPAAGVYGIEVEIALRLGRDLDATGEVADAVDAYYFGIELLGTRLQDRVSASVEAQLADNLLNQGYAINTATPWPHGSSIDFELTVEVDGVERYRAPAKNPFGTVLAALDAYRRAPIDLYGALRKGSIITTGTLCGVVPVTGPARVVARMGGAEVSVDLV